VAVWENEPGANMPHVVPSQVREFIEKVFKPPGLGSGIGSQLHREWSAQLAALLAIVEQIPDDLLTLKGDGYSQYVLALETIRHQVSTWLHRSEPATLPLVHGRNAVLVLYEALANCPDQSPSATTHALAFVDDVELRDSIRLDMSAADQDLVSHEYKGATVLAGSATEALLLWAVQHHEEANPGRTKQAIDVLTNTGTASKALQQNPEHWSLSNLIEVSHQLGLITAETAQQARLTKDFRNLIHPGRAARLGIACDKGTALSALASAALIVRDLTP
jgi:hypothetical protein